jgi:predicted esterase
MSQPPVRDGLGRGGVLCVSNAVTVSWKRRFCWALLAVAGALLSDARPAAAQGRWCAPELDALGEGTCFFAPRSPKLGTPRVLVIFLHGLVGEGSSWQWEQQRLMVRTAEAHGLSALMPRGRLGIGPGLDPAVRAWPNSAKAQQAVEAEVLAELAETRRAVELQRGKFDKVLVFGFSNGAYYAASLALRGKLDVDGYGVFAGGSGNRFDALLAANTERRVPIFVGYGTRDPDRRRQKELVTLLRKQGWPHRMKAAKVGHTVTDDQIRGALAFLVHADTDAHGPKTR